MTLSEREGEPDVGKRVGAREQRRSGAGEGDRKDELSARSSSQRLSFRATAQGTVGDSHGAVPHSVVVQCRGRGCFHTDFRHGSSFVPHSAP